VLAVQIPTQWSRAVERADEASRARLAALCRGPRPKRPKKRKALVRKFRPPGPTREALVEDDVQTKLEAIQRIEAAPSIAAGCRTEDIHRSTFYAWKSALEKSGLDGLRKTSRRKSLTANALPVEIRQLLRELDKRDLPVAELARKAGVSEHGARGVLAREVWLPNYASGMDWLMRRLDEIGAKFPPGTPVKVIRQTLETERAARVSRQTVR